jgi:hypothetical protein
VILRSSLARQGSRGVFNVLSGRLVLISRAVVISRVVLFVADAVGLLGRRVIVWLGLVGIV